MGAAIKGEVSRAISAGKCVSPISLDANSSRMRRVVSNVILKWFDAYRPAQNQKQRASETMKP